MCCIIRPAVITSMLPVAYFRTVKFEVILFLKSLVFTAALTYCILHPNLLSEHVSNNSPMNGSYFFDVKQYSDSNNIPCPTLISIYRLSCLKGCSGVLRRTGSVGNASVNGGSISPLVSNRIQKNWALIFSCINL